MKLNRVEILINTGSIFKSSEFAAKLNDVQQAIDAVKWPEGSNDFAIYPGLRSNKEHNGVTPIKTACMNYLQQRGWTLEYIGHFKDLRTGKVDAAISLNDQRVAVVEWETGNISSSHRALNKMTLGMLHSKVAIGFLILPSRSLYNFLTDRIGNFQELEPYFDLYRAQLVNDSVLAILEVEHDRTDLNSPRISLGTDGRATR